MSISAFGVDHGSSISKADKGSKGTPSGMRRVTAQLFPGWHGAVAGRKGKKLKATGYEVGGSLAGSTVGSIAGAAVGRGNPAMASIGGQAGHMVGLDQGVIAANKRGYFKKEPKR